MIHECNYCNYQSSYKSNLKTHVKNKHSEKISPEKENGKPMKNDHHKQLKKIEMMMKNNFQTGVEIETMKRKVKSLGERNANEFKELALEYVELTDAALPKEFFESLCGNYTPPPPAPSTTLPPLPTAAPTNKNEDLFGNKNEEGVDLFGIGDEETMDLFGNKIVKDEKQSIYKSYV